MEANALRMIQAHSDWTDGTVIALVQEWAALNPKEGEMLLSYLESVADDEANEAF